jgi:hypothetical protein
MAIRTWVFLASRLLTRNSDALILRGEDGSPMASRKFPGTPAGRPFLPALSPVGWAGRGKRAP